MNALQKIRKNKGFSQAELSSLVGVSQNTLAQWETGARKPNIIFLKKLAIKLNCTTDDLLKNIEV